MNPEEIKEWHMLSDKRESGTLSKKDYLRYLVLLNQTFEEGIPKVAKSWAQGFGL